MVYKSPMAMILVNSTGDHVLYDLAEAYGDDDRLLDGIRDQV